MVIGAIIATARFLLKSQADALNGLSRLSPRFRTSNPLGTRIPCGEGHYSDCGVHPTLDNLIVLAIIVVIRTFLSVTLQLEVEGHCPWQHPGVSNTKVERIREEEGRGPLNSGAGVELAAVSGS